MNIGQYFKEARATIVSNKLRSFLSILGIVIGVFSVIVMLAIGKGTEKKLMDQLGELAKNQIQVYAGNWSSEAYVKPVQFTTEMISFLERTFPLISGKISYRSDGYTQTKLKKPGATKEESVGISYIGVSQNFFEMTDRVTKEGTLFTPQQYEKLEPVMIINEDMADDFFPKKSPIGEKFQIGNKYFTIVGVLERTADEKMRINEQRKNYQSWIPYPYGKEKLKDPNFQSLNNFVVYLPAQEDNATRKKRISYALLKYYNNATLSEAGFTVESFSSYIEEMKDQQKMMNYLLLAIGAISLLVGGIGVMNIMLVSVTERTKEIGIRKALGALKGDVVAQFLVESILITFLGGILAVGLSYGSVYFINKYGEAMNIYAIITPEVVGIALIITCLTGIIFGILPARRAAKLNVIDALRYE